MGRIADKLLSGKIGSSRDSLNLGSARVILRSGRIVKNGRNEEIMGESNNSPMEKKDEERGFRFKKTSKVEEFKFRMRTSSWKGDQQEDSPEKLKFTLPLLDLESEDTMEKENASSRSRVGGLAELFAYPSLNPVNPDLAARANMPNCQNLCHNKMRIEEAIEPMDAMPAQNKEVETLAIIGVVGTGGNQVEADGKTAEACHWYEAEKDQDVEDV
ncbi:hypothetical protein LWI28_027177 [Acer negundo]|uniref:Uncharacterized protein n=1 Tax=Acer negundo TaxID=4023 RepID=A0AAD5JFN2_ACENE|nr:hypothetical protein LWI28_027177 [Acer negundo]